ncbi:MAG TPA: cytochrome P450 [Mycobacterium sp.]|uniref:cytochrome P450 n=1 Tax=Mycobacterium sp. TaxID=1785 RepID=UPI002D6DFE11|nr:cytochrome P450 [Mycobacterium sp.]HZU50074.1 cytochrome P450 [Mycobacterium sp.]
MAGDDLWSLLQVERKAGWDKLRAAGPVVEKGGVYYLTRRDDVLAALHNTEVFSSALRPHHPASDVVGLPMVPIMVDPPDHSRLRKLLQSLFTSRAVDELLPTLTRQAAALVDAVAADGGCDAMAAVAVPFAAQVVLTLLGLPVEDRDRLIRWKDTIATSTPDCEPYRTAAVELGDYLAGAISQRRHDPMLPGLLARLPAGLSDVEAAGAFFLMAGGGAVEPVAAAIGFALLALAADEQLQAVLRADPGQVGVFVDEIFRLEALHTYRVTTADVTIGGVMIPAGSTVQICLGAANREYGDEITVVDGRIVRRRHWGFGSGIHRCLGAHLARMEVELILTQWLARIPTFGLAPGYSAAIGDAVFRAVNFSATAMFTLPALLLRWTPSASRRPSLADAGAAAFERYRARRAG